MKIKVKNLDAITRIEDSSGEDITKREKQRIKEGKHGLIQIDHDFLKGQEDIGERIERDRASANRISRNAPLPGMDL